MTQSLEDYLEVIGNLDRKNNNPRVKDIADLLNVSKPSVHTALHQLEDRGMITHEHYGAITMTQKGTIRYHEIKHRHDTLKIYLMDILGVSEENAEKDACEMEHRMSEESFSKFEEVVKNS
jgi:DtxR family Mn-dependent transcriptional regulator